MSNLSGDHVALVPTVREHLSDLSRYFEKEMSQFYSRQFESVEEYYENVAIQHIFGKCQLFSINHLASRKMVGCTGFFNEDRQHRKVEIGGTCIGKEFQNSVVNPESKLLLLSEGFGQRNYVRIEFKTDELNTRSQAAMAKLGFKREGVLRNHLLLSNGRRRHSVFFSVIEEEWPATRETILNRIKTKTGSF